MVTTPPAKIASQTFRIRKLIGTTKMAKRTKGNAKARPNLPFGSSWLLIFVYFALFVVPSLFDLIPRCLIPPARFS